MVTSYRLARQDDVGGIAEVFNEAYSDLYRKRGFPVSPMTLSPPPPIFAYLIGRTPRAFWVAEEDGKVVGYSDSFVRGALWYFSWLFISPRYQGRDIGRNLLERTLGSWKGDRIDNRATMTFAFNPVSQFLYMKYGMYPREPVYYVEGPGEGVGRHGLGGGLRSEGLGRLKEVRSVVSEIDESVLGFPLDWHHEFFLRSKGKCFVFRRRGEAVGYAYVYPNGKVGPLAVRAKKHMGPVLESALGLAAAQGSGMVRYWTPGSNVPAVETAVRLRLHFDPSVYMSTKPFAKWENYLFHSAAMM